MNAARPTCTAPRRDGSPCQTPVVGGAAYCFGHDPLLQERRTEARRKGGRNRANAARLKRLMPASLVPVFELLSDTLGETYRGDLDPRRATAIASVARAMCAVLEHGQLEERLRRLEERAG